MKLGAFGMDRVTMPVVRSNSAFVITTLAPGSTTAGVSSETSSNLSSFWFRLQKIGICNLYTDHVVISFVALVLGVGKKLN